MINSEVVRFLRMSKNMTQEELAGKIGVTKVSICGYEKGTRQPSLETVCLLANYFDVTVDYLLGRDKIIKDEKNDILGAFTKKDVEIINTIKNYNNLYRNFCVNTSSFVSRLEKIYKEK